MAKNIMKTILLPATKNLFRPKYDYRLPHFQPVFARNLSSKRLAPSVTFISNESINNLKNKPDLSEFSSGGRSLSVLLCWLGAKESAVNKYAKIYLNKGFDVLVFRVTPWQMLLPKTIDPIICNEMLPSLLTSNHKKKLIHGFSVGGYVFAQMLKFMHNDPTGRSQELMKTMIAQVWDSPADVGGTSIGISKTLFMNSKVLQKSLQSYIDFHMRVFYDIATKYYDESHYYFYNKPLQAPALFLASQIDQISTVDAVQNCMETWQKMGIRCSAKYWSDTQHVGHMQRYPGEYKMILEAFIDRVRFQKEFTINGHLTWNSSHDCSLHF